MIVDVSFLPCCHDPGMHRLVPDNFQPLLRRPCPFPQRDEKPNDPPCCRPNSLIITPRAGNDDLVAALLFLRQVARTFLSTIIWIIHRRRYCDASVT